MHKEAVKHLIKVDKTLAKHIKKFGPCTLEPKFTQKPYEALVEAVVYQQLSGKAAATIFGRFLKLFPKKKFPTPKDILALNIDQLRSAGLSLAKSKAIQDIALKTSQGVVPTSKKIETLSDEEILERLTSIRGVGPWTVEMMLMFKLGRPDILPMTDYGVRKAFAKLYGLSELPTPKELLAAGEIWRPYRTTASWYLWRVLD